MFRLFLAGLSAVVAGWAAPNPADWIPLRWEGGPLEVHRRAQPNDEGASQITPELLLQAYEPAALELLADTSFNCLLLTWSLGEANAEDESQRKTAAAFAGAAQQKGLAALAVVEPGGAWLPAVRAAASAGFDGVALDGYFTAAQVAEAKDVWKGRGVVVALGGWRQALGLRDAPIVGTRDGVWPALFTAEDESDSFETGPTSNPWVLSNGWRVAALRAADRSRPVWTAHRPKRYRDQPFSQYDYLRAVADTAMAGGRWVVTLDGEWQAGLLSRDPDKLDGWRKIAAAVAHFEAQSERREMPPQPALVVVHDPQTRDVFSVGETLNLLAVRHVPHRVLLRADLQRRGLPADAGAMTFDFEPQAEEKSLIQQLVRRGGTLFTGPEWALAGVDPGLPRAALERGGVMAYPAEKLDEDRFATDLRKRLDESGASIRIFNTGTLMSFYTEQGQRGVLHLTEYSDYPTANVTVRFPRPVEKAVWTTLDGYAEDLEVYDTDGGGEIVIPEVPSYCAVAVDFAAR